MTKIASKHGEREWPCDLPVEPCGVCGALVLYCTDGGPTPPAGRMAVDMAPVGQAGNIAIQRSLIVDVRPIAWVSSSPTRFREHRCGSHVGRARGGK